MRGDDSGALFWPVEKGGRLVARRITGHALRFVLLRRAAQAGVAALSPHDVRRTFVSHLLDAGADISTVQALAGHASIVTTARYDRRGERAKQIAASLLSVPYAGAHRAPPVVETGAANFVAD